MRINKDTILCMSVSANPSNMGTRFHNYLYEALNLNYVYKAFAVKNIEQAVAGIRGFNVRGCAVSMPFKEAVIALLDEMDASAKAIDSVNTIVNTDGVLKGYNTDYLAVKTLLERNHITSDCDFILKGSGGMAKAVAFALKERGIKDGVIVARNQKTGEALAQSSGYRYLQEGDHLSAKMLINVTPIGMENKEEAHMLSFTPEQIAHAQVIFDVVAFPSRTPLILEGEKQGKTLILGADVFALQALEQFYLYTGVRPDDALYQQAAAFARG